MSLLSLASRLHADGSAEESLRRTILEALRSRGDEPSSSLLDEDPALCLPPPQVRGPTNGTPVCDHREDDLFRAHGWEL